MNRGPSARWSALFAGMLALASFAWAAVGTLQPDDPSTPPSPAPVPAFRRAAHVAVITLHGEIDAQGILARSVEQRIRLAERAHADAIVFDIHSPGGAVDSVLRISKAIKGSRIKNTVAWIHSDAYSGGAIVALACREIVIADPCSFGDAMPIAAGGPLGAGEIPPELLRKVLTPLVADITESVRRHNQFFGTYDWDEYLAKALVANDVELWLVRSPDGVRVAIDKDEFLALFPGRDTGGPTRLASLAGTPRIIHRGERAPGVPAGSAKLAMLGADPEDQTDQSLAVRRPAITPGPGWTLEYKLLDGTAPAMLATADMIELGFAANHTTADNSALGFTPIRSDNDLRAFFQASKLTRYDRSWTDSVILVMTHTGVRILLIIIFLVATFVEITHPGAAAPGFIALLALAGLIAPPLLIGVATWWALAAIVLGIVLLIVEIFVTPGFGAAGIFGVLFLFLGLLGVFIPGPAGGGLIPSGPEARAQLLYACLFVLIAMTTSAGIIAVLARYFGSVPGLNRLVLAAPGSSDDEIIYSPTADDDRPSVGDTGVAITPLRPAGRVEIDGRIIDAVAEFGIIDPGARVRVSSIDGPRVGVERLSPPEKA